MSATTGGRIVAVEERFAGTELAAAAVATDTEIEVVDVDELEESGELVIGYPDDAETATYTVPEDSEGEVTVSALVGSYDAETPVTLNPPQVERVAHVLGPDDEEDLEARVPHHFFDRLAVGIREDEDTAEEVELTLEGDDWVVTDVFAQVPHVDAAYLNTRQDEVPITVDLTGLTTSYQASDAVLTVTPEADGKLLVFWGADVWFEHLVVGQSRIQKSVLVSLLVDTGAGYVQVGQERRARVDAVLTVTPEADGKLLVFWGADVWFEHLVAGQTQINKSVLVSLLVDAGAGYVQVGQERRARVDIESADDGPQMVIPVSGSTPVDVEAGVEVTLAIGARLEATGTGDAYIGGSKTGGLSYVEFAA